jgi:hypothetical protein
MNSFSCPHLNIKENFCIRLKTDCVPGRKGCVLHNRFEFAIPAEERIKELEKRKRQKK